MATIDPTSAISGIVQVLTWTGVSTTTDTPTAYGPLNRGAGAIRACAQFGGTFGGATAVLQGSIDGTNFATINDINGNAISATSAKLQEFTSSALYFKPSVTGGTGDDVNIILAFRI